ncbi:MAG TPA: hypothetical protein QF753_08905 [Victivallales bacterium]|nr:hypothetical protein [Victivallales bacterium]
MLETLTQKTTMIGSMPQKEASEALNLLGCYPLSIPAWPQLPKRSFKEAMITQYSEGFPGIKVDEINKRIWLERDNSLLENMAQFYEEFISENIDAFSISKNYAEGLHLFLNNLEKENVKLPFIKGQITGPFTFGLGLSDNEKKPIWFDINYRDIVIKGLTMKALWQIKRLEKYADNVIIFMDEPILSALGTPAYIGIQDDEVISSLDEIITTLKNNGAICGVHCCGNMDWGVLARTNLDIIAFDAYYYGDKLTLYPDEIRAFLDRGGILAFGIVPTSSPENLINENKITINDKLNRLLDQFIGKGIPSELLKKQMIFTPSCGMGSLSADDSEQVLKLLNNI